LTIERLGLIEWAQ